jgi:hypothetical protein
MTITFTLMMAIMAMMTITMMTIGLHLLWYTRKWHGDGHPPVGWTNDAWGRSANDDDNDVDDDYHSTSELCLWILVRCHL